MKLFFSIIIGLRGLIFFPVSILLADDFNSIQWREALVTVEMDLNPIDGHEAHALGILQQRGVCILRRWTGGNDSGMADL